jgi:aspartyl-tRNA(Asn)/glutamyl-tRNA(Gln) amidotransferase subunit A
MKEILSSAIAEIAEAIRAKKISPAEVVSAHLQRAKALHSKLNAFVRLDAENALAQGRAAEAAVQGGAAVGRLHGVPLSVKSCIDVAGWPCPAASLLRKDYVVWQSRGMNPPSEQQLEKWARGEE